MKTDFPDSGVDYSARPVWISQRLYDSIRKIREEKGWNISSVAEELIERGIRCRNTGGSHDMHCRLCELAEQDK